MKHFKSGHEHENLLAVVIESLNKFFIHTYVCTVLYVLVVVWRGGGEIEFLKDKYSTTLETFPFQDIDIFLVNLVHLKQLGNLNLNAFDVTLFKGSCVTGHQTLKHRVWVTP